VPVSLYREFLKSVRIDDRILTDGGAVNPVPYDIIENDCDLLIAVDVTGELMPDNQKNESPNIFECIINSFILWKVPYWKTNLKKKLTGFSLSTVNL